MSAQKQTTFKNVSYISDQNLTGNQGSNTGTVLDPILDHIGNVQNWTAVSVQFSYEDLCMSVNELEQNEN